jgi:hypothetical protein
MTVPATLAPMIRRRWVADAGASCGCSRSSGAALPGVDTLLLVSRLGAFGTDGLEIAFYATQLATVNASGPRIGG